MDYGSYLKFVLALAGVIALIFGGAWLARRAGLSTLPGPRGRQRRLAVVEAIALDGKRRLVLVRRDEREHLLLIGGANDLCLDRDLPQPPDKVPQ